MEEIDKRIVEVARSAVKEYLERLMNTERYVFIEEHGGLRNGFYERKVKTKFREIEDLSVPRDREGRFRSAALEPYSRSIGLEELIISLYSKGVSTRKASEILEEIFQNRNSRSSISRITDATMEEVKRFQSRALESRYIAIFLDALSFFLRRDTVEKEPILFAMGIRESGEYEILGFYLASKESHLSYTAVINDLYNRGMSEPLLFIADGIPKLDEEIRKVFPRADFQLCTIHASRNFESEVRESDKITIDRELKRVFTADTEEDEPARLSMFKVQWNKKYPRQIYNLEKKVNYLFTYFSYPQAIRRSIHSNNLIERMNKEVRRRIKVIDSLPTEESALKIVYLRVAELNEKWSHRVLNGYFKCRDELKEMFSKRYQ